MQRLSGNVGLLFSCQFVFYLHPIFITLNFHLELYDSGYEVTLQKMANFLSESLCNERIVNPGKAVL